ncbi:MAG: hypothetical protein ACFFA3_05425 [Promethearchaeota archaeon]
MKHRLFLFGFLVFFLLSSNMVAQVNAIKYKAGIKESDKLIWKCKVCNQAEMNLIFGVEWNTKGFFQNLSKGSNMKWEINNIEVNETSIRMNFSIWFWTENRNWGVKVNDSQIIYYKDPTSYSEDINFTNHGFFVPFWFPIPVGDFMGSLNFNAWYDVDNRVLPTLNVDIPKDAISPGFPNKGVKIIAIYNDQGILSSYKLYIKGNVVIIDISLDFLPFYVLPVIIGLFSIISIMVVGYIIRKLKFTQTTTLKRK